MIKLIIQLFLIKFCTQPATCAHVHRIFHLSLRLFLLGVGVSGGSDSIALTYLAKQVFGDRVLAVTIDHK